MSLYVVRHGSTAEDERGHEKFSGWSEIPIDQNGIAHAHETGKFLANKNIHSIFTSDLKRALQTAMIIAQHTGARVYPMKQLRALNMGELSGRPEEAVKPYMRFYQEHPKQTIPGGESYGDAIRRFASVLPSFIKLADDVPQKSFGVLTHSLNLNMIPSIISGGRDPISRIDLVPDAGIVHITRDSNGALHAMPMSVTKEA